MSKTPSFPETLKQLHPECLHVCVHAKNSTLLPRLWVRRNCTRGELGSTLKQDSGGSGCFLGFNDKELCLHHCTQMPKVEWTASPNLSKKKLINNTTTQNDILQPGALLVYWAAFLTLLSLHPRWLKWLAEVGVIFLQRWSAPGWGSQMHQRSPEPSKWSIPGCFKFAKPFFKRKNACQKQVDENWLHWIKGNFCSKFWMGDEDIGCASISLGWHPTLVFQPLLSIHLLEKHHLKA